MKIKKLIKLRMNDYFDTNLYNQILMELKKNIPIWKENKSVQFLDEKTSIEVEKANLEIMDLLYSLIKE